MTNIKTFHPIFIFSFCLSIFFGGCSLQDQTYKTPHEPLETYSQKSSILPPDSNDEKILGYPIWNIIDGDTLEILKNGEKTKIRILGINTPEKEGGFRPAECFGDHASDYAKTFLHNKTVVLLESKTGDKVDKYGRLLRYVFVDGQDFGGHLITLGYAESYKRFPHDRKNYYNNLETQAQKSKKGMWNPENCEYWGQEN